MHKIYTTYGKTISIAHDETVPIWQQLRYLADVLEQHDIKYLDNISYDGCEGIITIDAIIELSEEVE